MKSLRIQILLGIAVIITPLVFLLYYNNQYAMGVVRDEVTRSNNALLQIYAEQTDKVLRETNNYLIRLSSTEFFDWSLLETYGYDTDEYKLQKMELLNKLRTDIHFYSMIDTLFLYSRTNDDLLLATNGKEFEVTPVVREKLPELLEQEQGNTRWYVTRYAGSYALVKLFEINPSVYAGAWVEVDSLVRTMAAWGGERQADGAFIVSDTGEVLTPALVPGRLSGTGFRQGASAGTVSPAVQANGPGGPVMTVRASSRLAGIHYVMLIPERTIMQNLIYFQRSAYLIPVLAGVILILYFLFFHFVIFGPIKRMIAGMKKIALGNPAARLAPVKMREFSYLVSSINSMVAQISELKVDVYEEKLRTQQAELKHLQVQIYPHFYLNCLNVVASLAELQEYRLIKKMIGHLVEYFRFVIGTNRQSVALGEEIRHIRNYLEIQKIRFPHYFSYRIDMPEALAACEIPPLSVQPFVENAIVHGMKSRADGFEVVIAVGRDTQEFVTITVADNGRGFEPDQLREAGGLAGPAGDGHVGIWNVFRRLKMRYGDEAYVRLDNRTEGGAVVTMRVPAGPASPASLHEPGTAPVGGGRAT